MSATLAERGFDILKSVFLGLGFAVGAVIVNVARGEEELVWLLGVAGAIVGFLGLGNLAYCFIARRKPMEAADNVAM